MDLDEFLRSLRRLSATDIVRVAARLRAERDRGDDLAWWGATLALDRSVRRQQRSIGAAGAAGAANRAVVATAGRAGLEVDAADVAEVARASAEVARTLVAEDGSADPCYFLLGWERIVDLPAWAPCSDRSAA